jgi:hypothetical protein
MIKKTIIVVLNVILILSFLYIKPIPSQAISTAEDNNINGKWFYIKNSYSGRYLEVQGGDAANGTNVIQHEANQSDAQKWCIVHVGNGEYSIGTWVGSEYTNEGRYIHYVLNVAGGSSENGANLQIYEQKETASQLFNISYTAAGAYIISTKVTNFEKVVTVQNASCDNDANVVQYQYNNASNDEWILEPVYLTRNLGKLYAQTNYNSYNMAYPNVTNIGGDCVNFVSQCLLASGVHYQGSWYVYRNNGNYSVPTSISELDNTWSLADPSPWISANEFAAHWKSIKGYEAFKGSYITANPTEVFKKIYVAGDVVQQADCISIFGVDFIGDPSHTMYIYDYKIENGQPTYVLTYHDTNKHQKSLLQICKYNPNSYFIFYHF